MNRIIHFSLVLFFGFSVAWGQEQLQNTLLFGKADAGKLLRAYTEPGFRSAMSAMVSGWHASARPLHSGRLNFQLLIVGAGDDAANIDLRNLGLQVGQIVPSKPTTATILGGDGGVLSLPDSRGGSQELSLLNGSALPVLPFVCGQFNVGITRNTELNFRLGVLPISGNLLLTGGWGFKHELKQWIPAIALSNFDVSVFGNFSAVSLGYNLTIDNLPAGDNPNDQVWKFQGNNFALGTIFSKRFSLLTVATGLQYMKGTGNMQLAGTYLVGEPGRDPVPMRDPISQSFEQSQVSGIFAVRLSLGIISVQVTGNGSKNPSASMSFIVGRVQRR